MARVLSIHVRWARGVYHGQEWPPSPFLLFQALIAGVGDRYRGRPWPDGVTAALRWLETQDSPRIYAPPPRRSSRHTLAVPNNDDDLAMKAHQKGVNPRKIEQERKGRRTLKGLDRWQCPEGITFAWAVPEAELQEHQAGLEQACGVLHTLGRGIDPAHGAMAVEEDWPEPGTARIPYQPREGGSDPLRVPVAGSLDSLEERFQARLSRRETGEYVDRKPRFGRQGYAASGVGQTPHVRRLHLRRPDDSGPWAGPQRNTVTTAAMIRHAAMNAAPEAYANFAAGYPVGSDYRLSWVPLPTVGHPHADGRTRRALLVAPPDGEEALAAVAWGLHYAPLVGKKQGETLARLLAAQEMDGVFRAYLDPATEWISATPLILPGYADRPCKREKLVLKALRLAGFEEADIADLAYQAAPFQRPGFRAGAYRFPGHLPYPQIHLKVRFRRPVPGPLLLGAGRHHGLGVMVGVA
ncbi:MAG: type I-U CRISPR-associated protein Csb2 [Thiohalospira sp.]